MLTSPAFVLALGLLLLNDWVLKAAIGNWVTGKLSDFAGLAACAMFWAAVFPRNLGAVFITLGTAFVYWKMPLSEPALRAWNSLGAIPVARVEDHSDLLALCVLMPTYRHVRGIIERPMTRPGSAWRRAGALTGALAAIVAFSGTSVYRPAPIEGVVHPMPAPREEVIAALDSVRIPVSERKKARAGNSADTLVVHIRHPPEQWVELTIEVRDAGRGASEVRTIALGLGARPGSTEALQRAFGVQVVQPLRDWLTRRDARAMTAPPGATEVKP